MANFNPGASCSRRSSRAGFTLTEATVALAVIAILAVIVAQCIVWSLRERARRNAHHAALEIAANVLEEARAMRFEHLNQAWQNGQAIPSEMEALVPEGKIDVTIEADKLAPGTRRITVEVRWRFDPSQPFQSVVLTTVLSRREATSAGGKP